MPGLRGKFCSPRPRGSRRSSHRGLGRPAALVQRCPGNVGTQLSRIHTVGNGGRCAAFPEGNVGAGTGTLCYRFKGGIGTASRVLPEENGGFSVGVLLQSNFGARQQLTIRGLPVGQWLKDWPHSKETLPVSDQKGERIDEDPYPEGPDSESGSCMMVVATDAPLSARQLAKLMNNWVRRKSRYRKPL